MATGRFIQTYIWLILALAARGAETFGTITRGPEPAWLAPELLPAGSAATSEPDAGVVYETEDLQIDAASASRYWRSVNWLKTASAVESYGTITLEFDPEFQNLIWHRVDLIRGTNRLDRLDISRIRRVQTESELNRNIYNGTVEAVLVLDDVRPGDRLDLAYTIQGRNPVFKGKEFNTTTMGWRDPVLNKRIKINMRRGSPLQFKLSGLDLQPVIVTNGATVEFTWAMTNTPVFRVDSDLPRGFNALPALQVSEYESWAEVARWAASIMPTNSLEEFPPEMSEWKKLPAEERLTSALGWVQNEVRYMAIQIGTHSHAPDPPAAVLKRRFGDCKDKSVLLCALLENLGLKGTPLLVGTWNRHNITNHLPAPSSFNHCVVLANDGTRDWLLDPTTSGEVGTLTNRWMSDFGYGLVVDAATVDLIPLARFQRGLPRTEITEDYDVGTPGEPVELRITTVAKGADAERLRDRFDSSPVPKVEKDYLKYLAGFHSLVGVASPLQMEDDRTNNIFITKEHYRITNFWTTPQDTNDTPYAWFIPGLIRDHASRAAISGRTQPMRVSHPVDIDVRTSIKFGRKFKKATETSSVSGPAFEFSTSIDMKEDRALVLSSYKTLADRVEVADLPRHAEACESFDRELGYRINWIEEEDDSSEIDWDKSQWKAAALITILGLVETLGLLWFHFQVVQKRVLYGVPPIMPGPGPAGIGGWLILFSIGIVIRIGVELFYSGVVVVVLALGLESEVTSLCPSIFGIPGVVFSTVVLPVKVATSVWMGVLFFTRHRWFVRVAIACLGSQVLFVVAAMLSGAKGETNVYVASYKSSLIGAGVWILYLVQSRRVSNTFIR